MGINRSVALAACGAAILTGVLAGCSTTPKDEEAKTALAVSATTAMDAFTTADPSLPELLAGAQGYAIFPEVSKAGLVVGGSHGRGEVYQGGEMIGYAEITQGTVGLQVGAQTFSELVVFLSEASMENFKKGDFSFSASVSAVAIKPGAAAATDTSKGVAVFLRTTGGLMAEAAIGGQSFEFEPLEE